MPSFTRNLLVVSAATLITGVAASPAHAAWPGREGRVALTVTNDGAPATEYMERIVTVRPDGSDPIVIRVCQPGTSPCSMPDRGAIAWSPDGTRLAVVAEGRLAVVNSDGSNWQAVTTGDVDAREPAWSPDGRRLAFVRGSTDVATIRPNGTGLRRLAVGAGAVDVAWSVKGEIAYATTTPGRIVKVDARGKHRRVLARADNPRSLDWSPDGKRLIFLRRDPKVARNSTWVVDAAGKRSKLAAAGVANAFWSPTGRRIASEGDDTFNLSRLNGSGLRAVTLDSSIGQWGFPHPQAWQSLPR
jgi:dipeptidyl aminopeptidase/acylaminoacyl peptidase